jgi:hypothetical protein
MNRTPKYLLIGLLAAASAASAQTKSESYEFRAWQGVLSTSVVGYDSAQAEQGTKSLKVLFDADVAPNFGLVDSSEFPPESFTPLATGFSVRVYAEAVGVTTGVPQAKLALWATDNSEMGGPDVPLTLNAWTTVDLPAANVIKNYKFGRLVVGANGSTGQFNLYVDNMQRDGVLYDAFEPGVASSVQLVNTEGASVGGPASAPFQVTSPVAGGGTDGSLVYAAQWSGDTNNTVEIQHNFNPNVDLAGYTSLKFDLYVPTGTALPTSVFGFFWDGAAGYSSDTSFAPTANDAWQSVTLDITGITTAVGFTATSVDELKLVLVNVPAGGRVYIDNVRLDNPASGVADWVAFN